MEIKELRKHWKNIGKKWLSISKRMDKYYYNHVAKYNPFEYLMDWEFKLLDWIFKKKQKV